MKSISTKLTLIVALLLSALVGLMILANSVFLPTYYINRTKSNFTASWARLTRSYAGKNEQSLRIITDLNREKGYKYSVVDARYRVILSSTPEFRLGHDLELPRGEEDYLRRNGESLRRGKVLFQLLRSSEGRQDTLQLAAMIGSKDYLLITQPIRQLMENASSANSLFLAIGAALLSLSILAAFFLAKRLVRPIVDMTGIAGRLAALDFAPRYTGASQDEIGRLGDSVNILAERLDTALGNLRRTNEQLQKEMQLQKRFLASVSHEFKTPVGLIRGYAESMKLEMAKTPAEEKEIAGIIIKEADRLNHLVNDVLLLLRLEVGAFQMRKRPMDLAQALREEAAKFLMPAGNKQAEIVVALPEALPILADGERIGQAISNILANSLHHVNKGGRITLRAKIEGQTIRTELTNTGAPIDEEHLGHVFEPFYRAEDARSRRSGGTGLGLSIVRGIIAAHDGQCGLENTGEGVVSWFELPLAPPSQEG